MADAERAVNSFDRIGVVVARGLPPQIEAARTLPGIIYLEGDQPLEYTTDTSHQATRGAEARET